jgi:hypothetical protein
LKEEDKFGTVMLDLSQPAEVIPVAVPYYWWCLFEKAEVIITFVLS